MICVYNNYINVLLQYSICSRAQDFSFFISCLSHMIAQRAEEREETTEAARALTFPFAILPVSQRGLSLPFGLALSYQPSLSEFRTHPIVSLLCLQLFRMPPFE